MRVLIAGGGTGGHLFPGIALAEEVTTRHPDNEVRLRRHRRAGSRRGWCRRRASRWSSSTSRGLKGMGPLRPAAGAARAAAARSSQSWRILRRYRPDVVVGVGGYASGPVVLAAGLQRHAHRDPGAERAAGLTNRMLGQVRAGGVRRLRRGARASSPAEGARWSATRPPQAAGQLPAQRGRRTTKFAVLVFGGSQGAQRPQRADARGAASTSETLKRRASTSSTRPGKDDLETVRQGLRRPRASTAEVVRVHRRHVGRLRAARRWSSAAPARPRWPS